MLDYLVVGVFGRFPWKADEPYSFGIIHEALEDGQWLVPHVADQSFVEEPPLVFGGQGGDGWLTDPAQPGVSGDPQSGCSRPTVDGRVRTFVTRTKSCRSGFACRSLAAAYRLRRELKVPATTRRLRTSASRTIGKLLIQFEVCGTAEDPCLLWSGGTTGYAAIEALRFHRPRPSSLEGQTVSTLDSFLEQGWDDHAIDAAAVAARLPEGLPLVQDNDGAMGLASLAHHVLGEHLQRWQKDWRSLQR